MTVGTQAQPFGKMLDYEQFIDHQLQRTQRRIKLTDVATACLILLVGFLGVLFLEVVFDHLFGMPYWLRSTILWTGLSAASIFAAFRLVLPLVGRINALYAAKTIEGADPAFKNSLINYLELKRHRDRLPKAVLATLESRAVNDLTQVDVEGAVNQHRLMQTIYALSAIVVVGCIYWLVSPRNPWDSVRRAFLADVVRPTNTQLINIKPGDNSELSEIVAGSHVNFEVDVQGFRPEKVLLHHSVDGGKFFAIKELSPGKKMYDPWQFTLVNVQQSQEYFLTGGDAESRHYRLDVKPAPTIVSISHDLDFPEYTKSEDRKGIDGGEVEAIEGTEVTIHARSNIPASNAFINFASTEIQPKTMVLTKDDPTQMTGSFTVTKSGTYRINFRTVNNQVNPSPVNYDIIAIPDRPPTARFILPDKPLVKVPANVKVDLVMAGSDDHGIKEATLHVQQGQELPSSRDFMENREPKTEFRATDSIDLAQLKARPGDKVSYWLTVRDNKEKASNRFETARQIIEVGEPVPPQEKKQFEEKQVQQRQQADQNNPNKPGDSAETGTPENPQPGDGQGQQADGGTADPQGVKPGGANGSGDGSQKDKGANPDEGANPQNDPKPGDQNQLTPEQIRQIQQVLNDKARNRQQGQGNGRRANPAGGQAQAGNPGDAQSQPGANPPQANANNGGAGNPQTRQDPRQNGGQQGAPGNNAGQPPSGNPNDPNNQVTPGVQDNNPAGPRQGPNNANPSPPQAGSSNPGQRGDRMPNGGGNTAQGANATQNNTNPAGQPAGGARNQPMAPIPRPTRMPPTRARTRRVPARPSPVIRRTRPALLSRTTRRRRPRTPTSR
jgi:hypothetical protein